MLNSSCESKDLHECDDVEFEDEWNDFFDEREKIAQEAVHNVEDGRE